MSAEAPPWLSQPLLLARTAIRRGSHALLLSGPRGMGKRELALRLAQGVLCDDPRPGGDACGSCSPCHWLLAGSHADFSIIEPPVEDLGESGGRARTEPGARERPIGIDQIRAVGERLVLSAHRAGRKVVVITPAEAMNPAAANALLKNLEEPPIGTVFLLVSHRPSYLLPTVRSRCQSVPITLLGRDEALAWLGSQGLDEAALRFAFAGGAPYEAVRSAEDPTWPQRARFIETLLMPKADPVATAELFKDIPVPVILGWMQKWTFDLLLCGTCANVRYNLDFAARVASLAGAIDRLALGRYHRKLLAWQRSANHPLNHRLFLEQILLRYSLAVGVRVDTNRYQRGRH